MLPKIQQFHLHQITHLIRLHPRLLLGAALVHSITFLDHFEQVVDPFFWNISIPIHGLAFKIISAHATRQPLIHEVVLNQRVSLLYRLLQASVLFLEVSVHLESMLLGDTFLFKDCLYLPIDFLIVSEVAALLDRAINCPWEIWGDDELALSLLLENNFIIFSWCFRWLFSGKLPNEVNIDLKYVNSNHERQVLLKEVKDCLWEVEVFYDFPLIGDGIVIQDYYTFLDDIDNPLFEIHKKNEGKE